MRTTINLDDDLLQEAKKLAAATGRSLTDLVEEALRERLARREAQRRRERVSLPTYNGGGFLPGVDLDDSAALLDLMERHDAAP
jgi:predicted transcriptional regulator